MKDLELLLMQDIPKLGRKGDIVRVKNGYGRNYLVPKGFANTVTKENLRQIEIQKKRQIQVEIARKDEMKRLSKELEVSVCTIEAKANEEGHLFGSVSYAKIVEAFQSMGFKLGEEMIRLEDPDKYPIKELGLFPIQIQLHPEVLTKSKIWVVNEENEG
jgi:large subunit ribosomal protein L9